MEKGLLFLTISVACLWVVLDDFYGGKKLSSIINNLTPDFKTMGETIVEGTKTESERYDTVTELKKKVDSNTGIKTDSAKKAVNDLIDHYYKETEELRGGKVY